MADKDPEPHGTQRTLAQQRSAWLRQNGSAPNLQCGKEEMFQATLSLLAQIDGGTGTDLDAVPNLPGVNSPRTWRQYASALRTMGVIEEGRGALRLSADGEALLADASKTRLATLMAGRIRLFAEALGLLVRESLTVEEVNAILVDEYHLDWTTLSSTRVRLTWLEVLGLIEWLGDRKLSATTAGREILAKWDTVSPEAVSFEDDGSPVELPEAPPEITALLDQLAAPGAHESRNTYNIWVPSPSSDPSKIENMRISISAALEPIEKDDLLGFIARRFGLKRSSVESMLPFMRAGGFVQEIRRGVFAATPAARAWLSSGSDLDFIRILHAHMRFIGELVLVAEENSSRVDVYAAGAAFGLNKEKIRWLIAFLIEAELLIDTSWSSIQSTPLGRRFVQSLPLAPTPTSSEVVAATASPAAVESLSAEPLKLEAESVRAIASRLTRTANDPSAEGRASGVAFEMALEQAFTRLGFRAQRIGGSGNTDVLVQWYDDDLRLRSAIVDGKSTSSGHVAHGSVSDLAIATHQDKHSAEYVAIVAPAFSGDTIRDMAAKKGWVLVTAAEIGEVVEAADTVGLRPAEAAVLFETPDGLSRLADIIESRRRELDLVSLVVARLADESENDEAVSARDISLIERRSELSPTIDELISTVGTLATLDPNLLRIVSAAADPQHETYLLGDVRPAVARLRAFAKALEAGQSTSGRR